MPSLRTFASRYNTRGVAALVVAVLAGSAIGVLLVPRAPAPSDAPSVTPRTEFLGRPLELDERAGETAMERVRSFVSRPFTLKLPDGRVKSYSLGRLGGLIDKVRVAELVRDAADATSPMRRVWAKRWIAPNEVSAWYWLKSGSTGPVALTVPLCR